MRDVLPGINPMRGVTTMTKTFNLIVCAVKTSKEIITMMKDVVKWKVEISKVFKI